MSLWRLFKRWHERARACLAGLRSPLLRRAPRKGGRFQQPPARAVASHLLRSVRAYRVYLPDTGSGRGSLPLLVMLHGCRQDALVFAEGSRMNQLADRYGFVVLYPEQKRFANALGCWNWFEPEVLNGSGEAAAIAGIVRRAIKRYPVDPTRVYIAGMSAGGAMACVLANCYGTLFAACAVHSGLMYRAASSVRAAVDAMRQGAPHSALETARSSVPASQVSAAFVPTLVIHGDRDDTVNPVNADQIIEQTRALAENDGTPARRLVESAERRVASSRHTYRLRDYRQDSKIVLRKIIVEGLGHAWSGGDGRHPFNDPEGPDASELIWEFLRDFRRMPGGKSAAIRAWHYSLPAIWDRLRQWSRAGDEGRRQK